jgi:hypothetical protein
VTDQDIPSSNVPCLQPDVSVTLVNANAQTRKLALSHWQPPLPVEGHTLSRKSGAKPVSAAVQLRRNRCQSVSSESLGPKITAAPQHAAACSLPGFNQSPTASILPQKIHLCGLFNGCHAVNDDHHTKSTAKIENLQVHPRFFTFS